MSLAWHTCDRNICSGHCTTYVSRRAAVISTATTMLLLRASQMPCDSSSASSAQPAATPPMLHSGRRTFTAEPTQRATAQREARKHFICRSSKTEDRWALWHPAQLCRPHSTAMRTCSSTSDAGPTDTPPEVRSTHRFCSQASRRSTTPDISRQTRPGSACVVRAAMCRAFTAVSCDLVRYTDRLFCMCRASATASAPGRVTVDESTRSWLSSKRSVCSVRSLAYASGIRSTREQLAARHVSTCCEENTPAHGNAWVSTVGICSDHASTTRCQHVSVGCNSRSRHWKTWPRISTCASDAPPCGTTRTSCTDCMSPTAAACCVFSNVVVSPPACTSARRSC